MKQSNHANIVPPVGITGMGAICAAGASINEIMKSLYGGERHINFNSRIKTDHNMHFPLFEIPDATFLMQSDGSNVPETLIPAMNTVKVGGVRLILTTTGGNIPFEFDGVDPQKGFSEVGFLTGGHFVGVI